jgi:hypothetical protein
VAAGAWTALAFDATAAARFGALRAALGRGRDGAFRGRLGAEALRATRAFALCLDRAADGGLGRARRARRRGLAGPVKRHQNGV